MTTVPRGFWPTAISATTWSTAVSMTLSADQQHYRYKVLETTIAFRNAVWNAP